LRAADEEHRLARCGDWQTDRAAMKTGIISLLVGSGLIVLAIGYCPVPWSAVLLIVAAILFVLARLSKHGTTSAIAVNVAAALIALACFEAYLGIGARAGDGTRLEGSIKAGFTHTDDVLGYAPARNSRVTARKYHGSELVYDVVYTVGPDGLRIMPKQPDGPGLGCILFFGDSITFGEGVNDVDPFPYRVAIKTGGAFEIHNLAFSGYGPHQMLAALQSGMVSRTVPCSATHVIYLAIPQHSARVAGLTTWGRHAPRFELTTGGRVIRNGNFDDPLTVAAIRLPRWLQKSLDRSFTWQRFFGNARGVTAADVRLFTAIMQESAITLRKLYPDSRFSVILRDAAAEVHFPPSLESELRAYGVSVHRLTQAIPDFNANHTRYRISSYDPHPNVIQHELLADYIVRHVLNQTPR
jgi:hypothetical protein